MSAVPDPALAPRETLADVRVRAPTRGNRRREQLLDAVNGDDWVKAWWHVSAEIVGIGALSTAPAAERDSTETTAR